MRKLMNVLGFLVGFGAVLYFGTGCITSPQDNEDIGAVTNGVNFQGFLFGSANKACIYTNHSLNGSYGLLAADTAEVQPNTLYGDDGYYWSRNNEVIPTSDWDCIFPLTGKAQSFIRVEEADDGTCEPLNGDASQDSIAFSYRDGDNLSDCYSNNPEELGNDWVDFWEDCPRNTRGGYQVVRVLGDWLGAFPNGCEVQCTIPTGEVDCDDSNECTADACNSAGLCYHLNVADGTACNGTSGNVCDDGECVVPACDVHPGEANCNFPYWYQDVTTNNGNGICSSVPFVDTRWRCWDPTCTDTTLNHAQEDSEGKLGCSHIAGGNHVLLPNQNPGVLCNGNTPISCEKLL